MNWLFNRIQLKLKLSSINMREIIIIIFFTFCAMSPKAQNLIPNPSFEDTVLRVTPLFLPTNWAVPNFSSPDYFTSLNWSSVATDGSPQNYIENQLPNSGEGYMGLVIYSFGGSSTNTKRFREYIQNRISATLQKDSVYCLQLFVSLADSSRYATKSKLGVYFSANKIQSNDRYFLPYNPQVLIYPDIFLVDKQEWMQYNFQYKASGGEQYLTIGNFTDSTVIDTLYVGGASKNRLENQGSYYYIDDVYLGSCDSIPFDTGVGLKENELIGRNHRLFPNPTANQVNLAFVVKPKEQFSFLLYDLQGKLVQEQLLQIGDKHHVPIEGIIQGLYLYQIRNKVGDFLSGKLVVE